MRNLRWQILIALGGLLLILGLLFGQGPIQQGSSPLPVIGGAYTEALVGRIVRLNPILDIVNQVDRDIDRLLFRGLVRFDSRGFPQPDLAESWAVSADASLYTFTLRDDVFWHDGTPVTSDDIVYTFGLLQDPSYPGPSDLQAFWEQIEVVRLDPHNVQFRLPEPFAPFLEYLAVGLLPEHLLRGVAVGALVDHPFNLEPVGTGPFRFDRFLMENGEVAGVSLVAFEEEQGIRPFLERFELRTYPDEAAALDAFGAGLVQGLGQVGPEALDKVLALSDLSLHTARLPVMTTVFINLLDPEHPYLADKSLRRALMLAINRQWIIDRGLGGQAVVAVGPILPGTWAFAESLEPVPFDLAQAANLLDALGWVLPAGATPGTPEYVRTQDGQVLSFELAHADDPVHRFVAGAIAESWGRLGIQVQLTPAADGELLEDMLEPRIFQAVLTELDFSRAPDPDPYPFWHDTQSENGQNYGGFSDRNISVWLEQARVTPDPVRRAELYRDFQYRFQDQLPALLLYNPVFNYAVGSQVQGIRLGPLFDRSDRFANAEEWYLVARRPAASTVEAEP